MLKINCQQKGEWNFSWHMGNGNAYLATSQVWDGYEKPSKNLGREWDRGASSQTCFVSISRFEH